MSLGAGAEKEQRRRAPALAQPLQHPDASARAHLCRPAKPFPICSAGLAALCLRHSPGLSCPGHSLNLQLGGIPSLLRAPRLTCLSAFPLGLQCH